MARWYVDGAGWNGSVSRYAVVPEEGTPTIKRFSAKFTNNEMEYQAIILALERANHGDEIFSDSRDVVKQLNHEFKIKAKNLFPYWVTAEELKTRKGISVTWVDRTRNKAGRLLERST